MQGSRAASTLELVVNEQQMQNTSQIDLSRQSNLNLNHQTSSTRTGLTCDNLRQWPSRFCDSLGAKIDEAKAKSDTRTEYAIEIVRAFSGVAIWLGCFVCTIIVPIFLLFVGLLNLEDCNDSPSLPYYVFTIGFVMTTSNLLNLALAIDLPILANHRLIASDIKNIIASILNIIFNTVVAFCYTLTAYKVLTITKRSAPEETYAGNRDPTPIQPDCSSTLYNFTFWFIALTLGSFVIVSALGLLLFLYNQYRLAIIRGSTPRSHSHPATEANNTPNTSPNAT